jgi:hypothetical protein
MKRALQIVSFSLLFLFPTLVFAGPYLDQASLLVHGAHQTNEWVFAHVTDKGLAKAAHEVALGRVKAAQGMSVPKEVVFAHPHLLLMMENSERAVYHASKGQRVKFLQYLHVARAEEATYRSLLKTKNYPLPVIKLFQKYPVGAANQAVSFCEYSLGGLPL